MGYKSITNPTSTSSDTLATVYGTVQVDVLRLLIEWIIVGAIMTPLFLLSRSQTYGWVPMMIAVLCFLLTVNLIAWFIWPKTYTEADGVQTTRITGTRYVWSTGKKAWITEVENKEDERAEDAQRRLQAKPVLSELKRITVRENDGVDHVLIYNPTFGA